MKTHLHRFRDWKHGYVTALFLGKPGIGKNWSIKEIVSNWNPESRERIQQGLTPDILEFKEVLTLSDYRERIEEFCGSSAKELRERVCIINNIDYLSTEVSDLLLKTVEDKKDFHIFITATNPDRVRPSLLSRLHIYYFKPLLKSELQEILTKDNKLSPYLKSLEREQFSSVFEVASFNRYGFEKWVDLLQGRAKSPTEVLNAVTGFMTQLKDQHISEKLPVIKYFVEYCSRKLLQECPKDAKTRNCQNLLKRTILRFSQSLFENLDNPLYYSQVNIDKQVEAFFLSAFLLGYLV